MKTTTKYYLNWDGEQIPLHPTFMKIARLVSRRTGDALGDVVNEIMNGVLKECMGTRERAEQFKAKCRAIESYCKAEGLNRRTFQKVDLGAKLERAYQRVRRGGPVY
jgi:hypothetical protein